MKCESCNGSGKYIGFSSEEDCKDCLGKGIIKTSINNNVEVLQRQGAESPCSDVKPPRQPDVELCMCIDKECIHGPTPHGHFVTVTGKVKWYNREHGWGFILQDNGSDVFVHYSQIVCGGHLFNNEVVEFEVPADQTYTTACGRSSQATKVRRAGCLSTRGA